MRNTINVLYITRKFPPQVGGMENFSYYLSESLKDNEQLNIKTVSLGRNQKHLIWFFPYVCLYTLINVRKYDILFIGDAVLCFLGIIAKNISRKTLRIINVFGLDITFKNVFYQKYLETYYKKCSDKYISISQGTDDILHKKYGDLDSIVITPGIATKNFNHDSSLQKSFRKKYGVLSEDIILLTVGRLVKRKGVEWFVGNVMPYFKDKPVKYFVIGEGKCREDVEKAVSQLEMSKQIFLLGKVEQEVLEEFYENSDIFIMPNIEVPGDKEGFGIVALESSMFGMIVMASELEGISDAIINGKNGYLLPPGDKKAFVDKIVDFYTNRNKYESKRKDYAEYTKQHFNWSYISECYVDNMKEMMKKR